MQNRYRSIWLVYLILGTVAAATYPAVLAVQHVRGLGLEIPIVAGSARCSSCS